MSLLTRIGLVAAASTLAVGLAGAAAPAQADTSWGCAACQSGR